ncbi:hypothetical protein B0T21DRAFT_352886 [Apiosordaria backusii]|uniref:Uncharacterized protein n=1 Tax=Apiosordaria backusii TaxID=314023 RepID=A0AA40A400_9PEZI|nr:hypothetical protein B0T21DRAFT_352886 [Apiosordaria backusii]
MSVVSVKGVASDYADADIQVWCCASLPGTLAHHLPAMDLATEATTIPPTPRRGPVIRVRRYGHNDFERFDEEMARGSHLCVGSASIGKVDIDCKYHWKKAQWGVLGAAERPAGIVYMDITFKQPQGYWLQRANVFITLSQPDEASIGPHSHRHSAKSRRSLRSDYAVQITQQFGPKHLTGSRTVQSEIKSNSLIPTIGAMGVELGGMGHQSTTSKDRVGQWVFKGTVGRPKGPYDYCTLEWEWIENELDPNRAHKQEYNTAFAFEHSERPVIMRVDVQGKLQSKSRQLKHGFLKFSSQFGKGDNSTLTHLDLSKTTGLKKVLDPIADGLDMAMQMENCGNTGTVVPDPASAQFNSPNQSMNGWQDPNHSHSPLRAQPQTQHHRIEIDQARPQRPNHHHDHASLDPILQSLRRRQAGATQQVPAHVRLEEMTTTVVGEDDSGYGTQAPDDIDHHRHAEHIIKTIPSAAHRIPPPSQNDALEQAIKEISRVPAIIILVNFLAAIARWLSRSQPSPVIHPSGIERDGNKKPNMIHRSGGSSGSEVSGSSESLTWEGSPPRVLQAPKNMSHGRGSDGHSQGQRRVSIGVGRRHMRYQPSDYY